MIWNSVFLKTLFDLIIIVASLTAMIVVFRHLELIKTLKLTVGIIPILIALFANALFHSTDLLIMYQAPILTSDGNWMTAMSDLHLNWNWIKTLISVASISIGISYLVHVLVPKTAHALNALREAEAALRNTNKNLEQRIEQRVAELESINSQLEHEINERKLTAEKLIASQSRWQSIVENAPNILFEFDRDGIIQFINYVTLAMDAESVIGRSLYDFTPQHEHERVKGFINQVFETGESVSYEIYGLDDNWYSVRISIAKHGEYISNGIMILTNITDLKNSEIALRHSEAKLLQGMKVARMGFWDWDMKQDITRWYGEMYNIYGINPEEFTGRGSDYFQYTRKDYQQRQIEYVQEAAKNGITEEQFREGTDIKHNPEEFCIVRPDGTEVWIMVDVHTIVDDEGNAIWMVGVIIDISQSKQTELRLTQSEQLIALKDRILSTVSHEFRTPLSLIQTACDLLTRYDTRLEEQRKQDLFHQIYQQVIDLTELIDDMLIISRAQSKKIGFNPALTDLEAFCRIIFEQIEFMDNGQHQFEFVSKLSGKQITIDVKLLQHILHNLLTNALKYTPQGQKIALELAHDQQFVTITVRDEGIGIPKADQAHLFEPFFRATNVGNRAGTGMGLAIVKEYALVHGGNVALQSTEDQGTSVSISLPMI